MPAQTIWFLRDPFGYLDTCRSRYGDVFSARLGFLGNKPGVVVSAPSEIRRLFMAESDELRAGEANSPLEPVLGKHSVGLLDGSKHLRTRRLMSPPFHAERLSAYT